MALPSDPRPIGIKRPAVFRDVALTNSTSLNSVDTAFHLAQLSPGDFVFLSEDFVAPAGTTLPAWLVAQDTSAAGSPTTDYVNDAIGGEYTLTTDAQSEAQNLGINGGDNLAFEVIDGLKFECRMKVNAAAIPWSADQRFVCGIGSVRDATLDDMTTNAWFRMEGASANILWETDDGTTDDDDNDTGIDLVDNTYLILNIWIESASLVRFYVDGVLVGTGDLTDADGNAIQVFVEMQRDAGTEVEALVVDYIHVAYPRI